MSCGSTIRKLAVTAVFALCASVSGWGQGAEPAYAHQSDGSSNQKISIFDQVRFDQRLNQQVPLNLIFNDENGNAVELKQYFGSKPVILSLVYFRCPMLCSQVMNGMAGAFNGITRFNVGRDFTVLTVSFDPRDTPEDAARSKQTYLARYRRPGAAQGWHFLTGRKDQIDALANAVGFHFVWDPQIQQFAHASGIVLLTPQGKLAQYYYGIEYAPRDIQLGIIQSSQGKIGNIVDKVILYCYEYDPARGKYGALVFRILRLSALATVLALGGFMVVMFRRDFRAARQNRLT